ncbi:MAG TPA: NAD-dependent epimerase/dehydratase family protein [Solirubrobacterales bacterium]|jgi:GDP-4-dehydro-6-deoxy-D-mannose reductase|nr:NAD-dependent epimerase/dehydratase family protein [Solirubrobacterales bacterium]
MAEQLTMLVLGANGFAGAHLATAAREAGLRVAATSRRGSEDAPACDLLDPASIAACLRAVQPDLVVNAAGSASVGSSWQRPAQAFAANATAVLNLLEAVAAEAPTAHVLCLSSADVYGGREPEELPLGEELQPRPLTPYGAGKAAMEALCGQYARGRGLRIAVARIFNLVGPGQSAEFALPGFARRIAAAELDGEAGVELALGNPAAVRDFVDVREGASALVELSRRQLCGTYNLCSGRGTTIAALVEELGRQARVPVTARTEPTLQRPADPPALVGDPRRLREQAGFAAATPLAQSLADLLDSWRAGPSAPA